MHHIDRVSLRLLHRLGHLHHFYPQPVGKHVITAILSSRLTKLEGFLLSLLISLTAISSHLKPGNSLKKNASDFLSSILLSRLLPWSHTWTLALSYSLKFKPIYIIHLPQTHFSTETTCLKDSTCLLLTVCDVTCNPQLSQTTFSITPSYFLAYYF